MKRMLMTMLQALLLSAAAVSAAPTLAAESEAMQRERALNRILVAERHEREREAAARGSGLMGITPAARASTGDGATKKKAPKQPTPRQRGQDRPPRS